MTSYFDDINSAVATIVIDGVLNYLESQNIDVSSVAAEDIATHLNTQYVPRGGAKPAGNFSSVPPANKASRASADGEKCAYVFSRGAKEGEPCDKPATGESYEGHPRCKSHSAKAGGGSGGVKTSKTPAKSTTRPAAPRPPAPRAPPPSSAPRRDTTRQSLRSVPNNPGMMFDPKSTVVVDNAKKTVVGIYVDGEIKNYLPAQNRKDFAFTTFTIPDDLPENEEDIFLDDAEAEGEADAEANEGDGETEAQADAEADAEGDGEGETEAQAETEAEPEPAPVKRPPPSGPVKRPPPPTAGKRPPSRP